MEEAGDGAAGNLRPATKVYTHCAGKPSRIHCSRGLALRCAPDTGFELRPCAAGPLGTLPRGDRTPVLTSEPHVFILSFWANVTFT